MLKASITALLGFWVGLATVHAEGWDWELGVEYRHLPQNLVYGGESDTLAGRVRLSRIEEWNQGSDLLEFDGFYRWSEADSQRSHGDIQDLAWIHVGDDWELRTGFRTVFWGVTEFQHLVDIINQKDFVERIDGEARLGQPMVNLSLVQPWGILDLFALVGFRERTFAGSDGWPRGPLVVADKGEQYESSRENKRVDFALRWSQTLDSLELAVSYFSGTSREPEFHQTNADGQWIPYYPIIDQLGVEALYIVDLWILKLEAISRSGMKNGRYMGATLGFEYTYEGVFDSVSDLGVVVEYNFDERGLSAPATYFMENDLSLGLRWALNDEASSVLLVGMIYDHKVNEKVILVEASRRLGAHWKLNLDATFFSSHSPPPLDVYLDGDHDPNYKLAINSHNDLIQLELIRYF